MRKAGALGLVLALVFGIGLRGQVPAESRTFLLLYDDLHLEFGSTPRVRDLTLRMVTDLTRQGDRWAIVSTGTSSISVPPTSAAAAQSAIRRVTGNGHTARSFLDARQRPDSALELRRRAAVALSTATGAIKAVSQAQGGAPFAVLYVSNGYDLDPSAEPAALIRAAVDANAHVYTIDPRGLSNVAATQRVGQADWNAYLDATRTVLTTLASRTQGIAAFTEADLDSALARLAVLGR